MFLIAHDNSNVLRKIQVWIQLKFLDFDFLSKSRKSDLKFLKTQIQKFQNVTYIIIIYIYIIGIIIKQQTISV